MLGATKPRRSAKVYPTLIMPSSVDSISQARQARRDRNLPLARSHYAEAAEIYRGQNDNLAYAHTIRHIADIFVEESNLTESKPLYEEALELYRSNLNTKLLDLANTVRPYALLNEGLGNKDAAMELWQEARNLYRSLRIDQGVAECESHITRLQRR